MDQYRESYMKKKELINSANQTPKVMSLSLDGNNSRSSSPAVAVRRQSVSDAPKEQNAQNKKIVFRHELEESKKKLDDALALHKEDITNHKNDILHEISNVKEQFQSIQVKLEGTKTEHLKLALNDAIKQNNDNVQQITSELSKIHSDIQSLIERVSEIESMLV